MKTFRLGVQHNDAHEALAGRLISGIDGHRRELVHRAVHVGTKFPIDLGKVSPQGNSPEPELPLNIGEADLSRLSWRVLTVVTG